MIPTSDDDTTPAWRSMLAKSQERPVDLSRERLLQIISELHAAGRVTTRSVVKELTGKSYGVVDDHLKRLFEEGAIRRVLPGVYEPVTAMPPPRAVSVTRLQGGWVKIEAGDDVITLTPEEERMLAASIAGAVGQFQVLAAGRDLADQLADLREKHFRMKEELRAQRARRSCGADEPVQSPVRDAHGDGRLHAVSSTTRRPAFQPAAGERVMSRVVAATDEGR